NLACVGTVHGTIGQGAKRNSVIGAKTAASKDGNLRILNGKDVMKHLQVGDLLMAVATGGERGYPLLLVHGFPLDHTMWRPQIDYFVDHCRVIAPDLRGFGGTDVTPGAVTMEQMADDLNALLDVLEVREKVIFCGLSMGGYIGWQFWRKYSDRVAAMILCDTRSIADT